MGLDNMRLKVFTALAVVACVLGVIATSNAAWSHETIKAIVERVYIKWGPWHLCATESGFAKGHTCLVPKKSFSVFSIAIEMTSGSWSSFQATRAFTVLSLLTGFASALIGVFSFFKEIGAREEMIATVLSFVAAACGFIAMCVWAGYANKNQHEYGGAFVVIIVSWMLFLVAAVVSQWERAQGIPENVRRYAAFGVAAVITLLAYIAICLNDWSHSEIAFASLEVDSNWGLFNACYRISGTKDSRKCDRIKSSMSLFGIAFKNTAKQMNLIRSSQAFMIFTVMATSVAVVGTFYATFMADKENILAKFRVHAQAVGVFCSFITMCTWAGYVHTTNGYEFGSAFALNACIWAMGAVWVFVNFRDAQAPVASRDYMVTTGEGVI